MMYDLPVTKNSSTNERNAASHEELSALKSQDKSQYEQNEAYAAGETEGFRKGFSDFEQRLAASNLYAPAEQYQEPAPVDDGNYGLLDEVESLMGVPPENLGNQEESVQTSAFMNV